MKRPDEMNYDELEKYREHLEATKCWHCSGTGKAWYSCYVTRGTGLKSSHRDEGEKVAVWFGWRKCAWCGGTGQV